MAAGTGPSAVANQTGEYKRIVDWIAVADQEVQQEHDNWKFMFNTFTLNTVAADGSYTGADCIVPVTDLRVWRQRSLKCYLLATGVSDQNHLGYIDYEIWDVMYNTGQQTDSRPIHWTIGNAMEILLGPIPNDVYRVSGEYQRSVTVMTMDADSPIYPAEFHMLPVYLGMMKYGRSTGASELYEDGQRLYAKMLNRMRRTQLPRLNALRPLA